MKKRNPRPAGYKKKTYPDLKARERELYEQHFGHPPPKGLLD